MQPFTFHTPTKICFGEDTARGIGDTLFDLGASNPLVVTDANLLKYGVIQPVLEGLAEAGVKQPVIFDQVPPDSDLGCVRHATKLATEFGCDSVIAIGGGSVLDTGKVANIGMTFGGDVLDYEGMNTLTEKLKPFIAVPTTAGTGSEVSAVAMIKCHEDKKKLMFGSRYLFPDVAILDPLLLLSLPPRLTAATGLDALTHAIESYVAMTKNSPSDALCLEAMRLIFDSLPRATNQGTDVEARSSMLIGSMLAGMAFTNAGVGLVHAIAHSIGGRYGTHHGLTNAVILPFGMEFNCDHVAERFASSYTFLSGCLGSAELPIGAWFAQSTGINESGAEVAATKLIAAVRELNKLCGLPSRLRDIGVPKLSEQDLIDLADNAITDPAIMFNPKPVSTDELIDIIKRAY